MMMSYSVKMSPQFSSPLVSSIVTLYALVLLYLPSIVFSPVLIITAVLLLSLLRLGATQRSLPNDKPSDETTQEYDRSDVELLDCTETDSDSDSEASFEHSFVKWNLRAPLEVIYEDHEEGDEEASGTGRYENLARFYPESDSGDSSDGDFSATGFCGSPENLRFEWEEEDERDDGLIEIALDGNAMKRDCNDEKIRGFDFQVDEENLIEIDISPVRSND